MTSQTLKKPVILDFSPLFNIGNNPKITTRYNGKETARDNEIITSNTKILQRTNEAQKGNVRATGEAQISKVLNHTKTSYKAYSKTLEESFIIDPEGGLRFEHGACYSREEIARIKQAPEDTKIKIHRIKTLFANSTIEDQGAIF